MTCRSAQGGRLIRELDDRQVDDADERQDRACARPSSDHRRRPVSPPVQGSNSPLRRMKRVGLANRCISFLLLWIVSARPCRCSDQSRRRCHHGGGRFAANEIPTSDAPVHTSGNELAGQNMRSSTVRLMLQRLSAAKLDRPCWSILFRRPSRSQLSLAPTLAPLLTSFHTPTEVKPRKTRLGAVKQTAHDASAPRPVLPPTFGRSSWSPSLMNPLIFRLCRRYRRTPAVRAGGRRSVA